MAAPIVNWTEADGATELTFWQMGKVNAGQSSAQKTMLIWNNKAGLEDVSDMQDAQITTTDNVGDTMDLVADQWVNARCNSKDNSEEETPFEQIGGDTMLMINAKNCEAGIIKGIANNGTLDDVENYASLTLFTAPPLNVPAGKRAFKTRLIFYYT